MNTKLLSFTNSNQDGITGGEMISSENTNIFVGGISVPKYLQSNDNNASKETNNRQYKRFSNYIVPVGLSMNKIAAEKETRADNHTDNDFSVVNANRFETLLFSVGSLGSVGSVGSLGKDLGISRKLSSSTEPLKKKDSQDANWFSFISPNKNKTKKLLRK